MNIYKSPRWFLPSEWFRVRAAEVRYDPSQARNAKGMWCKEGANGMSLNEYRRRYAEYLKESE